MNDIENQLFADFKSLGKSFQREVFTSMEPADFENLKVGEFGFSVCHSFEPCGSSTLSHLLHVLSVRHLAEMGGINAWWIIARVAAFRAFREFSFGQFIGKYMSHDSLALFGSTFGAWIKTAIAVTAFFSGEYPATIFHLFDFCPKPFHRISSLPHMVGNIEEGELPCNV